MFPQAKAKEKSSEPRAPTKRTTLPKGQPPAVRLTGTQQALTQRAVAARQFSELAADGSGILDLEQVLRLAAVFGRRLDRAARTHCFFKVACCLIVRCPGAGWLGWLAGARAGVGGVRAPAAPRS